MRHHLLIAGLCLLLTAPAIAEVKLEIGPDTTVIDGPVNPDGTLNYLAYLNEKLSEGVTPENNFAVDVARVMPPAPDGWISETFRDKVFEGLGVEKPVEGPFIATIRDAISKDEDIAYDDPRLQDWLQVISSPWKEEDQPQIKHWLDGNIGVLDRIQEHVALKDKYHFPLVVKEGEPEAVDMVLMPWLGALRELGRLFQARAEWHIADGNLDGALSDVRVIRQIAKQQMKHPYVMSWLVGVSIDGMAALVIEDLAASEHLTGDLAKRIIADPKLFSRVSPYDEQNILYLRFTSHDLVMHYWKGRGDLFPGPDPDGYDSLQIPKVYSTLMESDQYDLNVTLRAINDYAGRWAKAGQIEDYHERLATMDRFEKQTHMLFVRALKLLDGDLDATRLMRGEVLASNTRTAAVTQIVLHNTFTAQSAVYKTQERINMRLALAPLALAIGGYHAEHGEYPPDLHALVPAYLDSLPTDFATGELPVYRVENGAAIVYSLGTDLEDDGGVDDPNEGDIVFRIER